MLQYNEQSLKFYNQPQAQGQIIKLVHKKKNHRKEFDN